MEKKGESRECEPARPLPTGNETILFVDDEPALTDLAEMILQKIGYKVMAVADPVEALEMFKKAPDAVDLIITDKTMPQMTGFDLAGEIKAIHPDIPIILCTGFSEKINGEKAKEIGAAGYLDKPHDKRDLAMRVRQVLDGK